MDTKLDTKITLYNADNKRIGETFSRRARQLVKQQRAQWTDETHTAVRFLPDAAAEWEMGEAEEAAESIVEESRTAGRIPAPTKDASLYALAKKRLQTRRRLFWNALFLIPGYALFAAISEGFFWRQDFLTGFSFGVTGTLWTMLFIYNVYMFRKYNRGYLHFLGAENRTARKLAEEVDRLKRMGYEG
jgi:hypothetical protein